MPDLRVLGPILLLLLLPACSAPPEVEVVQPTRGALRRSFTEQARTRLSQTFLVPMPVDGSLSRVTLREGDKVRAGQVLATVDTVPLASDAEARAARVREMEARLQEQSDLGVEQAQKAQAEARLTSERETRAALEAQEVAARATLGQARTELQRVERLFKEGFVPLQQVEQARLAETTADWQVREARVRTRAQEAVVAAAAHQVEVSARSADRRLRERAALQGQLQAARADLRKATHEVTRAQVKAPISGVVLKRFETGPGHLSAGTRLLELGRLADLEALAEVLTQDALNLRTGMPVTLQAQDGGQDFGGTIKSLEPAGFTKPSSLGVEQQRVDVLIGLASPPPGLGGGYRVQATFVTETRRNALLIPRSAVMQAPNGDWYVFVCEADVLRQRPVRPGLRGDRQIEVLEGVREGESLVALPDSTFHDGGKVKPIQPRP